VVLREPKMIIAEMQKHDTEAKKSIMDIEKLL